MPSYKEHVLVSILMVFPFFQDVFYIALAVIGASMIDMDHHVNQKNITIVGLLGIILSLILYILHLPYLVGILVALMALLFYLSEHRGFMHSLLGIIFISGCVGFFVLGAYTIMTDYGISLKISLMIISLILGIVILNKKLVPIYAFIIILALLFTSNQAFNTYYVFISILIGAFSHILLDLFTKAGVELFSPISSQKFHKLAGFTLLGLYLGAVIISVVMYGNHFMWF